jgi:hypothetical protein
VVYVWGVVLQYVTVCQSYTRGSLGIYFPLINLLPIADIPQSLIPLPCAGRRCSYVLLHCAFVCADVYLAFECILFHSISLSAFMCCMFGGLCRNMTLFIKHTHLLTVLM